MKRLRSNLATAFLALSLGACGPSLNDVVLRDAYVANNTSALSLEAAQGTAELLYRAEQLVALERAAKAPGATKETVATAVDRVRDDWQPIKAAFERARQTQAALAQALRAGADIAKVGSLLADMVESQRIIAQGLNEARKRVGEP